MHGDISVSLSSRRELGGNYPPPPPALSLSLSFFPAPSHECAPVCASLSRSFSPFFPRPRSQILTYDYVGGASARISPESRAGRRNGFADFRGHGGSNSGDPRSREGGRERERDREKERERVRERKVEREQGGRGSRTDEREIEVRGGGGRRNRGERGGRPGGCGGGGGLSDMAHGG